MKNPIPLTKAEHAAKVIVERLQPFCARIEIAGSIRRRRPYCGDIDLVALPKEDGHSAAELRARIVDGKEVIQNGPQNIHVRLTNGIELQVFLARPQHSDLLSTIPSNWGSLLLLRTGSREHNIRLVERAKAIGRKWSTYEGVFEGNKLIASESEEAIFDALKLPFTPPHLREYDLRSTHNPAISLPGSFHP